MKDTSEKKQNKKVNAREMEKLYGGGVKKNKEERKWKEKRKK